MKIPKTKTKDCLTVADFSKEEIYNLFELTKALKRESKQGKFRKILKNKTLAMIFEKSSTRTRVSFETGMFQLGGKALFLSNNDIQLGRGEPIADTARVLSRFNDAIMIRTFEHEKVEKLAKHADIPIINGLTDSFHPCQALTDFFTIYEREKNLSNIKIAYIGDGNNMAHSLILASAILGSDISIACPKKYSPEMTVIEQAYELSGKTESKIEITTDIEKAVFGADYLYTDVWTSMGQEKEIQKRKRAFAKYKITMKLLAKTGKSSRVLHCLPAHRGEEISGDVIDSPQSIIFDQAENRLHCQKAILCSLIASKKHKKLI